MKTWVKWLIAAVAVLLVVLIVIFCIVGCQSKSKPTGSQGKKTTADKADDTETTAAWIVTDDNGDNMTNDDGSFVTTLYDSDSVPTENRPVTDDNGDNVTDDAGATQTVPVIPSHDEVGDGTTTHVAEQTVTTTTAKATTTTAKPTTTTAKPTTTTAKPTTTTAPDKYDDTSGWSPVRPIS